MNAPAGGGKVCASPVSQIFSHVATAGDWTSALPRRREEIKSPHAKVPRRKEVIARTPLFACDLGDLVPLRETVSVFPGSEGSEKRDIAGYTPQEAQSIS